MPANENHIRDLERIETVAEARFAASDEPGAIDIRVRSEGASFDSCEFDYHLKKIHTHESGDVLVNVEPQEQASTTVMKT